MVYARDLKSLARKGLRVRVSPPAPSSCEKSYFQHHRLVRRSRDPDGVFPGQFSGYLERQCLIPTTKFIGRDRRYLGLLDKTKLSASRAEPDLGHHRAGRFDPDFRQIEIYLVAIFFNTNGIFLKSYFSVSRMPPL